MIVFATRSTRTARQPGVVVTTATQRGALTCDELEVTVVAEHPQDAPDRRIDETVRRGRRCERHLHRVEQGADATTGRPAPWFTADSPLSARNLLQATSTAATWAATTSVATSRTCSSVTTTALVPSAENDERPSAATGGLMTRPSWPPRSAGDAGQWSPVVVPAAWSTCVGGTVAIAPPYDGSFAVAAGPVSGNGGRHGRRLAEIVVAAGQRGDHGRRGWHRLRGSGRRRDHREDADTGDAAGGDPAREPAESLAAGISVVGGRLGSGGQSGRHGRECSGAA